MMRTFYVDYVINLKTYRAGPYATWDEAIYQRDDIAGYEGVSNVIIVEERIENDGGIGQEAIA